MVEYHDFIFGYGSLLCQHSRSLTLSKNTILDDDDDNHNNNDDDDNDCNCGDDDDDDDTKNASLLSSKTRIHFPVLVQGLQRIWCKRATRMTAMGIRFQVGSWTRGILFSVVSLEEWDLREEGYDRLQIHNSDVVVLEEPWNNHNHDNHDNNDAHVPTPFMEKGNNNKRMIRIWVYVPQKIKFPSKDYPIVQSYVDTILRGCWEMGGEECVANFLVTTIGWHPEQFRNDPEDQEVTTTSTTTTTTSSNTTFEATWVNDRCQPIYSRCDPDFIRENGDKLDDFLLKYIPNYVATRVSLLEETG
jgi:hypothetical protein